MAHEISQVIVDGKKISECGYALQSAWHGLGTVLDHVPNSEEMIKAAHLDWTVSKTPLFTQYGPFQGQMATVRDDNKAHLGVVSPKYQIVQNREAFDFIDSLLQDGIMGIEAAGALYNGSAVWVLGRMPSVDEIAPGDNCERYVLFTTTHDGTGKIIATPTSTRVVCANTLRIATQGLTGFRHMGDMGKKMEQARQMVSQFDKQFTLFRDHARKLVEIKADDAAVKLYIETLFPPVEKAGKAQTIRNNKVDAYYKAMSSPRQNIPTIAGSWWSAFNSFTETIDHDSTWKATKQVIPEDETEEQTAAREAAAAYQRRENRMASLTDGPAADKKNAAFDLALKLAGVAA